MRSLDCLPSRRRSERSSRPRITGSALEVDDIPIPNPPLSMGASVADSSSPDDVESRTLTFAELKNLIEQGKTDEIPNNRHIPEAINVSYPLRTPPVLNSHCSECRTLHPVSQLRPPGKSHGRARPNDDDAREARSYQLRFWPVHIGQFKIIWPFRSQPRVCVMIRLCNHSPGPA